MDIEMATKKTTKKAEEVKKTAEKAVAETEKVAKKAAAETEKVAKKAAAEVKKAVKEPEEAKKTAKKAVKKVEKETKAAAKSAKKTAEKALINTAVKGLFFEYGDKQVDASTLAELAKEDFKANGGKGAVRNIQLYVKAEDNALYYVINGKESGKVEL